MRKAQRWLTILLVVYLVLGVALYFFQEKLLFHPKSLAADHVYQFDIPFKEINLPFNDKKSLGIVQFTVADSICKGVVLYFHGNRRNIERYARFARNFTRNGYAVWMIDYPGFGKSTGDRTERIMYADAVEFYKMALARYPADSIIIFGKSMGTGPATYLASRRSCKRLILETPYYSIEALFNHYAFIYPVSLMTKYHFPNNEYIAEVTAPVTIFHGTDDEVIPFRQARRLKEEAGDKAELISIEDGKHNNLNDFPIFQSKLDSLLRLP